MSEATRKLPIEVPRVPHCPRCGKTHVYMDFRPLTRPSGDMTHWCLCPQTKQPILMNADLLKCPSSS